jgi:NDP-sugar pyrophosphorylase family protein
MYIVGAGDFARKAFSCAALLGYEVMAFVGERTPKSEKLFGVETICEIEFEELEASGLLFIAIGNQVKRQQLMRRYSETSWTLSNLIHPTAYVSSDVLVGRGVYIAAGAVIECGCSIGEGAIIDIGVLIDHDCRIPAYAHVRSKCAYYPKDFKD